MVDCLCVHVGCMCGVWVWVWVCECYYTLVESIAHISFAVSPVPEKIAVICQTNLVNIVNNYTLPLYYVEAEI